MCYQISSEINFEEGYKYRGSGSSSLESSMPSFTAGEPLHIVSGGSFDPLNKISIPQIDMDDIWVLYHSK